MTHVVADLDRCEGYANCVVAAPQVFDVDDDGKVVLLRGIVDDDEHQQAAEAVRSCPVAAIWLEER